METVDETLGEIGATGASGAGDMNPSMSSEGDSNSNGATAASASATTSANNNICRDFMRNVCTRGKKCKFTHPEGKEEGGGPGSQEEAALLQDSVVFCHDFQNRNDCNRRHNCRFIHCRKDEEEEFKRSGYLPPHIRDQAITKGVAPDLPALYGGRPICKDFLKGDCRRGRGCRFRHLSPMQYDLEMSNCYNEPEPAWSGGYGNGYGYDDVRGGGERYEQPPLKRRREYGEQPMTMGGYGGQQPHSMGDMDMVQHENMLLKSRVEELKKQVTELTTTNNFLLEQNAQLRLSHKGPQPLPVSMAPQAVQPAVSLEIPMPTTSISLAPQPPGVQSMHPTHEPRMVSYPGRM